MNKRLIYFVFVLFIISSYGFTSTENNETQQEKFLQTKDLNVKSFFKLFTEKYKKDAKFNFVTLAGDFPENWVKPSDVPYLISIMHSKKKCCSYMNFYSSHMLSDHGEVGGFAILFLNSYISQKKIDMGLNCNPKTDKESVQRIEKWYQKNKN